MRLLTWNIRHGGGYRVDKIADWIADCAPDVVVLTESRATPPSLRLRAALATLGLEHQIATALTPTANGVLLASRLPMTRVRLPLSLRAYPQRFAIAQVAGLRIVGTYFPATGKTIRPVFESLLRVAPLWLRNKTIMLGDFNAGHEVHDCEKPIAFTCARHFEQLLAQGWVDAWRAEHGLRREYSWRSHTGNGFRIDHAFVSPALAPYVHSAHYDHTVRDKLSDHSALLLAIELQGGSLPGLVAPA